MAMHNRKFVPGGACGEKIRIKNDLKCMDQDYVEKLLIDSGFYNNPLPFEWVGLIYCYEHKTKVTPPRYSRISKKYGDLPLAVDLDRNILLWADKNNLELMQDIFMIAALDALIHAGNKYKCPVEGLIQERAKYTNIPLTIEECEAYQSPNTTLS